MAVNLSANVHESLNEIHGLVESLVNRRDQRRGGFVKTIIKAMETKLAASGDAVGFQQPSLAAAVEQPRIVARGL